MIYEDRINREQFQPLYKALSDDFNPDFADFALATQKPHQLTFLQGLLGANPEEFKRALANSGLSQLVYDKYKKRKKTAEGIKKDGYNKDSTIRVIKTFINGNYKDIKEKKHALGDGYKPSDAVLDAKDTLLPLFGQIRSEGDINKVGSEISSKEPEVGLSVVGITDKPNHFKLYDELADMIARDHVVTEVETTPGEVDEYQDKTQLEDLDPYSNHSPQHPLGYDTREVVKRDLMRDYDDEFHISRGKIAKTVPSLAHDPTMRDRAYAIEEMLEKFDVNGYEDLAKGEYDKDGLMRTLREKMGLSPYVINYILNAPSILAKQFPNGVKPTGSWHVHIEDALAQEQARPFADKMVKQRSQYGSDRRLKHITSAIAGVL